MENSMCYNSRKISLELEHSNIERAPHPAYSPDNSQCDFWLFGFLKEKLEGQELSTSNEVMGQLRLFGTASLLKSCRACSPNGFNE
jgi:hypothetical protein